MLEDDNLYYECSNAYRYIEKHLAGIVGSLNFVQYKNYPENSQYSVNVWSWERK